MSGQRPFDSTELGTERRDELDDATVAASRLDAAIDPAPVRPSAGFTNRVMASLADEAALSSAGFLAPVRRRGFLAGFGASVSQAWRSVFSDRPALVRATALAYVLVVVLVGTSLAGVATIGIAGALGKLGPPPTQSPSQVPGPTTAPNRTDLPSGESEPPGVDESNDPKGTPGASDDRGGSGGPNASDDHGGVSSSPGTSGSSSDDHGGTPRPSSTSSGGSGSGDSGSGSGSGSGTPKPSDTPSPTGTPQPSETPH